jgi:hypothetical protein
MVGRNGVGVAPTMRHRAIRSTLTRCGKKWEIKRDRFCREQTDWGFRNGAASSLADGFPNATSDAFR